MMETLYKRGVLALALLLGLAGAGWLLASSGPAASAPAAAPANGPAQGTPTACPIQFTDVPPLNPYYPFIRCLACRGLAEGYCDGTFRPGDNVLRGTLAQWVT